MPLAPLQHVENQGFAELVSELAPELSLNEATAAGHRLNTFFTTLFEIDAPSSENPTEKAS